MCGLKDVVFSVWWSQSVSPLGRLQSTVEKHSRIPADAGIGKSMETFCLAVFLRWTKFNAMPWEGCSSKFDRGGSEVQTLTLLHTILYTFKDVCANCFCAYLLRMPSHSSRHESRTSFINNNRAHGHCYSFAWI